MLEDSIRIIISGFQENQPFHSTPGTKEQDMMLTLVFGGKGSYRYSGGLQQVEGGMVGLVPPQDPGILMSDQEEPYHHFYCRFTGDFARDLGNSIIEGYGQRFFSPDQFHRFFPLSQRLGILHYSRNREFGPGELILLEILESLLAPLLSKHVDLQADYRLPSLTMEQLEAYLADNLSTPFDQKAMAAYFGLSCSTLWRRVTELCGMPPVRFAEKTKIEWAKTLFSRGRFQVQEVGMRVGYPDPFYFSKVFRKVTGVSPKQFRAVRAEEPGSPG